MKHRLLTFQLNLGRLGSWTFSPGIYLSLSTLLLLTLFVYLGFWQVGRGAEKQTLQNELETRITLPALDVKEILEFVQNTELASIRYRQVQVTGKFLNDKHIFLDNQVLEGKVGYRVLTPLEIEETPEIQGIQGNRGKREQKSVILIDRGWIPLGRNREELPSIVPIEGLINLIGRINQAPSGFKLGPSATNITWPLRVLGVDFEELSQQLRQNLIPVLLQLQEGNVYAFQVPPISFKISAQRHLGYAFQWFTLALAVFIYYLVSHTRRALKYA